jgi:predicted membrane-bound dolichyl-phosphate-mannose-protein mannosyltransferase
MTNAEKLIRDLCAQDEMTSDGKIKFSEEEIQEFLNDEHPFIARMIRSSFKIYNLNERIISSC